MKKHITPIILLLVILFISQVSIASADTSEHTFEYFEDGSYIETVIESEDSIAPLKLGVASLQSTSTTKSKTAYYKNASGKTLWYVKVTGTFTYGSGRATCTSSTVKAASNAETWKISNKSASRSGATATASATATQYIDGTKVLSKSKTVSLTCSPTGTFK